MTKPPKQLVADFYLALLDMPDKDYSDWFEPEFKELILRQLSGMLNSPSNTVQHIFESMAVEDAKAN